MHKSTEVPEGYELREDAMWNAMDRTVLAALTLIATGIGLDVLLKVLTVPIIQTSIAVLTPLALLMGTPALVVKAAYENGWLDDEGTPGERSSTLTIL